MMGARGLEALRSKADPPRRRARTPAGTNSRRRWPTSCRAGGPGHGYLLGVSFADPRDGSFLPASSVGGAGRPGDVRTRIDHALDPADARRLRGRPDPVRARPRPPTTSWPRWSRGSPTPCTASRDVEPELSEAIADDHGSRPMTETTLHADPPARGAHASRSVTGWLDAHGRRSTWCGSTSTTASRSDVVRPDRVARLRVRGVRRPQAVRSARRGSWRRR